MEIGLFRQGAEASLSAAHGRACKIEHRARLRIAGDEEVRELRQLRIDGIDVLLHHLRILARNHRFFTKTRDIGHEKRQLLEQHENLLPHRFLCRKSARHGERRSRFIDRTVRLDTQRILIDTLARI